MVTSLCFETPVVTASTLLEDSFFEKTESIVVLQTTKYVSEDVSVSCLRSIRIQTEGETDRLIVDIKPIYLEYLSDKLTVASPISIDHDLVHTYELSLNHETKLAKLTFPERILTPEYSHGYLFAQHAFANLIAWGLKEAPEYRFLCLAWETDRHNIDWEPVFRSLGFRITHFSIGKTVYGVCESAHLKSLLERDTSEYIRKINAQGFIWSLKRDLDESMIYSYRDEDKIEKIKNDSDTVIEALHSQISNGNALLFLLCIVIAVLIFIAFVKS